MDIHPGYAEVGAIHEENHASKIQADREVPFKRQVGENSILSGRVDFLLADSIDECKASYSKTAVTNAAKGKPKYSHLSQLVCYLLEFGLSRGRLVYGYYERLKTGQLTQAGEAIVEVKLRDKDILLNGTPSGHQTDDLVNTILQLDKWYHTDTLAPRPTPAGFMNPCKYCPLAELCDDPANTTVSGIREKAHALIASKEMPIPKIKEKK